MKNLMLGLVVLLVAAKGMACSMEVDQNYTKNLLAAHGVSYNDHFLGNVKNLTVTNYQLSFEGGSGGGSCPDYIITSATIAYEHSPNLKTQCSYELVVTSRVYMGDGIPDGAIEDISFSSATAACSTSSSRLRIPRKIPLRLKPVIRFPR